MNDDLVEKVRAGLWAEIKRQTDKNWPQEMESGIGMVDADIEFAALARAAISAVEGEGWQPIDSAPKDGTMVLLAIEPIDEGYLLGWNPERTITVVIGWWGYSEWTSHLMEEGTADTEGYSSPYQITVRPTHWRPLPQPPESKGEKM